MMRGGAGRLFNNIRDTSTKVVQTVASYAKSDLDITYITSRLAGKAIYGYFAYQQFRKFPEFD